MQKRQCGRGRPPGEPLPPTTPAGADQAATFLRQVVVLNAEETLDTSLLTNGDEDLLVLSVGYPQTPSQRDGVEAALGWAVARGRNVEARLALTMDDALDALDPGDHVVPAGRRPASTELPAGPIAVRPG